MVLSNLSHKLSSFFKIHLPGFWDSEPLPGDADLDLLLSLKPQVTFPAFITSKAGRLVGSATQFILSANRLVQFEPRTGVLEKTQIVLQGEE